MKINWHEPSTLRGVVWAVTSILSLFAPSLGLSTEAIWATGAALAGVLGVGLPDKVQ
jgi:hypothetical protein